MITRVLDLTRSGGEALRSAPLGALLLRKRVLPHAEHVDVRPSPGLIAGRTMPVIVRWLEWLLYTAAEKNGVTAPGPADRADPGNSSGAEASSSAAVTATNSLVRTSRKPKPESGRHTIGVP
jgi:hypothetical protein